MGWTADHVSPGVVSDHPDCRSEAGARFGLTPLDVSVMQTETTSSMTASPKHAELEVRGRPVANRLAAAATAAAAAAAAAAATTALGRPTPTNVTVQAATGTGKRRLASKTTATGDVRTPVIKTVHCTTERCM